MSDTSSPFARSPRSPRSPSSRHDTETTDGEHDTDDSALEAEEREKARLEAELDAAKDELFGPRRKKRSEDDDEDDGTNNADHPSDDTDPLDEALTDDQLINFDLGELDITTAGSDDNTLMIDFEEIDEDLMHFSQDDLVKEALQKGVDLRIYSATIATDIQSTEELVLMDYITNAEELSILYHAAKDVASKLMQANTMLSQFQSELSVVSAEISDLQSNSLNMSTKVKNRTKAQKKLHHFIQTVHIPDDIQQQLTAGDMNSATYPLALTVLDQHLSYLSHATLSNTARALDDALPQIERTRKTTLKRVTQFLLEQINIMSKPTVNILIHQRSLLKLTPLYAFLAHQHADKRGEESSQQVRDTYSELMSRIFLNKFKKYFTEMKKFIQDNQFDKTDLLGQIEGKKNSLLKAKKSIQDVNKLFILGDRNKILEGFSMDQIIPLNSMEKGIKLPFEQVYRSAQAMLVESAVSEYDFIVAFFGERERATAPPPVMDDLDDDNETPSREDSKRGGSEEKSLDRSTEHSTNSDDRSSMTHDNIKDNNGSTTSGTDTTHKTESKEHDDDSPATSPGISRHNSSNNTREPDEKGRALLIKTSRDKQVFNAVFNKTFAFFREQIDNFIFITSDPLAILLIIRSINTDMSVLTQQHIHVLDFFFDGLTILLWPKFKQLFDAHVESIAHVPDALVVPPTPKKPVGRGQAAPTATTDASGGHYVCTRYADFAVSILTLNRVQQDDILTSNLRRMRQEVEKLLSRSAAKLSGKSSVVYLIHQYHALLKILQSTGFESEDSQHFSALANTQISLFVDEELNEKFGRLVQFVKSFSDDEVSAANSTAVERSVDLEALDSIVKHFAKYWKDGIEALHTSVTKCFDPAINGGVTTTSGGHEERVGDEILKQVLLQLLRVYQRFQEIIKKYARNKPNITKDVVPTSTIMFEVRKYSQ